MLRPGFGFLNHFKSRCKNYLIAGWQYLTQLLLTANTPLYTFIATRCHLPVRCHLSFVVPISSAVGRENSQPNPTNPLTSLMYSNPASQYSTPVCISINSQRVKTSVQLQQSQYNLHDTCGHSNVMVPHVRFGTLLYIRRFSPSCS
jgi:hypothetical protein